MTRRAVHMLAFAGVFVPAWPRPSAASGWAAGAWARIDWPTAALVAASAVAGVALAILFAVACFHALARALVGGR